MGQRREGKAMNGTALRTPRERKTLYVLGVLVVLGVLAVDQGLKFWVKTNFYLGEEVRIFGNWFLLHFTENNGIAFGLSPSNGIGKLLLSLFRIGTALLIAIVIWRLVKRRNVPRGVIVALMFIFAGALGNIIDGTFYGLLFSSSEGYVPTESGELLAPVVAKFLPADMRRFSMARWLTCSISRLLIPHYPPGSRCGGASGCVSSNPYSMWRILPLRVPFFIYSSFSGVS